MGCSECHAANVSLRKSESGPALHALLQSTDLLGGRLGPAQQAG